MKLFTIIFFTILIKFISIVIVIDSNRPVEIDERNKSLELISVDDLVDQIIKNQSNQTISFENDAENLDDFNDESIDRTDPKPSSSSTSSSIQRNSSTSSSVYWFPSDFMSTNFRKNGGFLLHLLIFIYLSSAMFILMNDYFVPTLKSIQNADNLSANIIASTWMVLGTTLPSLFNLIINDLVDETFIGTGSIVVSSIFNMLAIPGVCGLMVFLMKKPYRLLIFSWPIRREIIFYLITIIAFLLSIKDDSVDWLESLVFIFISTVYLSTLFLWSHFELYHQESERKRIVHCKDRSKYSYYAEQIALHIKPIKRSETDPLITDCSDRKRSKSSWLLSPFFLLFRLTISKPNSKAFLWSYSLSIVWILILTYLMMMMISFIKETFHLTQSSSVLTMLALGNLTKLLASIVSVKHFRSGDMIICHSIASNIFHILICLGIPWLLKIFILTIKEGSTLQTLQAYTIPLDDCLFEYVAVSLTFLFLIFMAIVLLNKWQMTLEFSILSLSCYLSFLICLIIFDRFVSIV